MTPIHLRVQHYSATDFSCYSVLWLCDFVGLMSQNTQLCHECLKTSSIMQEYKLPNAATIARWPNLLALLPVVYAVLNFPGRSDREGGGVAYWYIQSKVDPLSQDLEVLEPTTTIVEHTYTFDVARQSIGR